MDLKKRTLHKGYFYSSYAEGYALLMVLLFMALLFILTTSLVLQVHSSTEEGLAVTRELESLTAADSGIQYALEKVRWQVPLRDSAVAADWHLLQSQQGESACFKVFVLSTSSTQVVVQSYGELVRNGCGEHSRYSENLLSAKILEGTINLNRCSLVSWQEVLP